MVQPFTLSQPAAITLAPAALPYYALRTTMRMFAALVASLLFTFTYATLAAKSRRAEMVLIPLLDVLQSVPILGYLSFTVVFFVALFPGNVLGPELAAIFAIFTSQAWNMAFSFYQSLRTMPRDLDEASRSFRFSGWQRFWRLEVPFAMPGLGLEHDDVDVRRLVLRRRVRGHLGRQIFRSPCRASARTSRCAIEQHDLAAVGWAILAMTVTIVFYDQLLFRPLVAWADKFRYEQTAAQVVPRSWVLDLFRRCRAVALIGAAVQGRRGIVRRARLAAATMSAASARGSTAVAVPIWLWYRGRPGDRCLRLSWRCCVLPETALSWDDVDRRGQQRRAHAPAGRDPDRRWRRSSGFRSASPSGCGRGWRRSPADRAVPGRLSGQPAVSARWSS